MAIAGSCVTSTSQVSIKTTFVRHLHQAGNHSSSRRVSTPPSSTPPTGPSSSLTRCMATHLPSSPVFVRLSMSSHKTLALTSRMCGHPGVSTVFLLRATPTPILGECGKWLPEFVCVQDGPHQRLRFGHIAPADSLAACDLHEQGGAAHERRESR